MQIAWILYPFAQQDSAVPSRQRGASVCGCVDRIGAVPALLPRYDVLGRRYPSHFSFDLCTSGSAMSAGLLVGFMRAWRFYSGIAGPGHDSASLGLEDGPRLLIFSTRPRE